MKNSKERGKLILLQREGKVVSLLLKDNRLLRAGAYRTQQHSVGDIIIGKVQNVVQNIQAAFVELGGGNLCFLPLKDIREPVMTNRVYDGRILAGDELVLQLTRDAVKTKEPVASTSLSFTGKYAVITRPDTDIRYSGKLPAKEKQRIRMILERHDVPARLSGLGLIIRTNAAGLLEDELLIQEIDALAKEARELIQKACFRTCFAVLRKAPHAYLTAIRDLYREDCIGIVTDNAAIFDEVHHYLSENHPEDLGRLTLYDDSSLSLNSLYGLESKLKQALSKQVWLPSGGYLVIEPTEALTVIDVNTGKYTGRKNAEDTFYLINKEACEEIAVQLPLRNLSGIILVDFINMKEAEHQNDILRLLAALLQQDSIKTTVVDMTPLGLVEITRKKINKSLMEQIKQ